MIANTAEKDALEQQAQIDDARNTEAAIRPDSVHRAILFLLKQAAANNRDVKREADYHAATIDRDFGLDEAAIQPMAEEPPIEAPVTAVIPAQSSRFKRR